MVASAADASVPAAAAATTTTTTTSYVSAHWLWLQQSICTGIISPTYALLLPAA